MAAKKTRRVASRRKSQAPNPFHSPSRLNGSRGKANSSFPNPMHGFSADSKSERGGGFSLFPTDADLECISDEQLRCNWNDQFVVLGMNCCIRKGGVSHHPYRNDNKMNTKTIHRPKCSLQHWTRNLDHRLRVYRPTRVVRNVDGSGRTRLGNYI